jgi:type VI secretion system protein ImpL
MRDRLTAAAPQFTITDLLGGKTDAVLSSSRTVSTIYSQDGWDRFVSAEITNVTKDPFKVDWVLGITKEIAGDHIFDEDQMRDDITAAFLEDVYVKWMEFLGSVSIEPMGDIVRCGTVLQKLSAEGSELNVLLENVLANTTINVAPKEDPALDVVKKMTAKKTAKITKALKPLKGLLKSGDPVEGLKTAFDPLRNFVRSEGRLGGLSAYRDRMSVLAEAIMRCAKQGNVISVFNGKNDDPLQASWTHSQNLIIEMPEATGAAVTPLLQKPLSFTGSVLVGLISKELNQKWQNDVAAAFTNKFAGKYPFSHTDDECSFEDVMEYFRPNTGSFWGFYNQNLAPYIVRDGLEWKTRSVGCVTLVFTKELFESLKGADKITHAFFNVDGTLISQKIALLPLPQNKLQGSIIFGSQEYKILPDENRVRLLWPVTGQSDDVMLKIFVNQNYTEEMKFTGKWGLIRLFESARVNTLNSSSFVAKWERNVQNMFMVQYGCHVQIAGAAHPFGDRLFSKFDCPLDIVNKEK